MSTLFITGIDTDIGKTFACGVLAKTLLLKGFSLYSQKLVETGCEKGISNDLRQHEKIVGSSFNDQADELHCPYRFKTPASPHLAAELDGETIDQKYLAKQMNALAKKTDHLLIEGAGGLFVPLNAQYMLIDFIVEHQLPIVLVTSPRLGSINHTLLNLELCLQKGIDVRAIIYNHYPTVPDWMLKNTHQTLREYLNRNFSRTIWLNLVTSQDVFDLSNEEIELLLDK